MYRVLHYKAEKEAKLIQRMMVCYGFGCTMRADDSAKEDLTGATGAVLYRHRTLVARGFFEAADHLREQPEVLELSRKRMPGKRKKAQDKYVPISAKPKVTEEVVKTAVKVSKPADPFAIEIKSGPGF
jgi:hypothetical protein